MKVKTPSLEKIRYLFKVAKNYKDDIVIDLNECFELSDSYFKITDTLVKKSKTFRTIDHSIISSRKFLTNFTMANVFNKNNIWAKMQINPQIYAKLNNTEVDDIGINEINKILEKNSDTTFQFIKGSNYYTEISKAIKMAQYGTGIFKINEQKSLTKPFSFEFMNYDNIYFSEDALGKPVIVFKVHYPMNKEEFIDRFSQYNHLKIPDFADEFEEKKEFIETMIGIFNESTGMYQYYNAIISKNFEDVYCEEFTEYPRFIIFRWSLEDGGIWGTGPARDNKGLFKKLRDNIEKRERHRDKIVDPPINFIGNINLMYKISLESGAVNYGGSGMQGDSVGVHPINLDKNLIPIDNDIQEQRTAIQNAFLAQPLGTINDSVRSATEQSLRIELFNKEWSTTGELINTEVLYPTFTACYLILRKLGLLEEEDMDDGYIELTELVYMNELTRNTGVEEVQQIVNYYNLVGALFPEYARDILIKPEELAEYAGNKMRIPNRLIRSKDELLAMLQQKEQMQQQIIMSQMNLQGAGE